VFNPYPLEGCRSQRSGETALDLLPSSNPASGSEKMADKRATSSAARIQVSRDQIRPPPLQPRKATPHALVPDREVGQDDDWMG